MTSSPAGLVGREHEVDVLTRLVEAARRGQSQVLVVQGDPGVGKTALVDRVVASASDARVLRAVGVESEMELPFAALHQLCSPVLDRLDGVPGPQRDALSKVFGLSGGLPPDRFLVGLGALSLLAGLGAEQPLVCFVDDAQWLDQASAQTMAFVARRLLADPVALVFATRGRPAALAGFPPLVVAGLRDSDARVLLASVLPFVLDRDVRERVIAEAGGNPLALLELPRDLRPAQLADGFAVAAASPVSARIEETFRRRLDALPADTRGLMLVAAAEPVRRARRPRGGSPGPGPDRPGGRAGPSDRRRGRRRGPPRTGRAACPRAPRTAGRRPAPARSRRRGRGPAARRC
jgi:hypothetical protein